MSQLATLLVAAVLAGQANGAVVIRDVAAERYPTVGAVVRVVDATGKDVPGLAKSEFTVLEDGKPVSELDVRPSFREGGSLAVEMLIDTSGSMKGEPLAAATAAAQTFLNRLGPDDRVGLITFGRPEVDRAPIGPPSAITGLDQLTADGYTALYGAINLAVARLASQPAKARAIVVLTDGRDDEGDNRSNDRFDRLRQALAGSTIPIHAIGFISPEFDPDPLRALAVLTGGSYRETGATGELAALYRQIADVLLPEYRITYKSAAPPGPHTLRIEAQTPHGKVVAEHGFTLVGAATPAVTTPPARESSTPLSTPLFVLLIIVLLALAGVGAFLVVRRRRAPLVSGGAAPAHARMVLEGPGVAIPLANDAILVGRDPAAQVIIDDPMVSRQHARLRMTPQGLVVEDLGSSNGTLVNGVAVTTGLMRPGDVLEIGELRLRLQDKGA